MRVARDGLVQAIQRSSSREIFGSPIASKQVTQVKLAEMFVGLLLPAQLSVGKLDNVREALGILSAARTILGGDGVTSEYSPMRHMANLESVRTYEGTDEVHALVIGRELTGLSAF